MVVMNMLNPQYIRDYITKKFGKYGKLSANSVEFIMPSPYLDNDWKCHFSINLATGLWQCFKTGKVGNFITLYAYLENTSYRQAYNKIAIASFFNDTTVIPSVIIEKEEKEDLDLLPVNIHSHKSEDPLVAKAWHFLFGRNLFNLDSESDAPYYVCKTGRYENRLIIPFVENDKLFYFQARALDDRKPKYLNPFNSMGVKPSDILYPYNEKEDHLLVCEGPFDAISLQLHGVNATCTMGCNISDNQAEMLKDFQGKLIVGYDNDDAGARGLEKFEQLRLQKLMNPLHVCELPNPFKDWNEAHISGKNLKKWVYENTAAYDYSNRILGNINSI
jgi:hypothetical protein